MLRILRQFSNILRSFNFKHFVSLAENVDGFVHYEIGAECYAARLQAVVEHAHLKNESIKCYVAVIAGEKICLVFF